MVKASQFLHIDAQGKLWFYKCQWEWRIHSIWQRPRLVNEVLLNLGLPSGTSVCQHLSDKYFW